MSSISDLVIQCHQEAIASKGFTSTSTLNSKLAGDNNELDSLGFVYFLMNIEEQLEIDLDSHLMEMRECNDLSEFVDLIVHVTKTK